MKRSLIVLAMIAASLAIIPGGVAGADSHVGGTVVVGLEPAPSTFNPYGPDGDQFVVTLVGQALNVGVFDVDGETRQRIPEVVTELPSLANGGITVNPDGTMTVRYEILPEAQWADGVPISGDDFQFTYETLVGIGDEEHSEIIPGSTLASAKSFEYSLPGTTTSWEALFGLVLPKHDVEGSDFEADWNDTAWVSGGPFVVSENVPGVHLELTANANYWKRDTQTDEPLPLLEGLTFKFYEDDEALLAGFVAGEVDIAQPIASAENVTTIQGLAGVTADINTGLVWEHLNFQFQPSQSESCSDILISTFQAVFGLTAAEAEALIISLAGELPYTSEAFGNRNPSSLNRHLEFRQAVAHLVDRDAIVDEILNGLVPAADSYVDAFNSDWSQGAWAQYDHDPATARALLAELETELGGTGSLDGRQMVFSTTSNNDARQQLAVLLDEMLSPVLNEFGIEYVAELEPSEDFFSGTFDCHNWDVGEWAWVGSPGLSGLVSIHEAWDPSSVTPFFDPNYYRWGTGGFADVAPSTVINPSSERFSELLGLTKTSIDESTLVGYFNEMENILADEVVMIPLYQRPVAVAYQTNRVAGVVQNASVGGFTWNIEEWFDPDRDDDGVLDTADVCLWTDLEADAADAPAGLKKNRFWSDADGNFYRGSGEPLADPITVMDTGGCSASQVIEAAGLGNGHQKFGISSSALEAFIRSLGGGG